MQYKKLSSTFVDMQKTFGTQASKLLWAKKEFEKVYNLVGEEMENADNFLVKWSTESQFVSRTKAFLTVVKNIVDELPKHVLSKEILRLDKNLSSLERVLEERKVANDERWALHEQGKSGSEQHMELGRLVWGHFPHILAHTEDYLHPLAILLEEVLKQN